MIIFPLDYSAWIRSKTVNSELYYAKDECRCGKSLETGKLFGQPNEWQGSFKWVSANGDRHRCYVFLVSLLKFLDKYLFKYLFKYSFTQWQNVEIPPTQVAKQWVLTTATCLYGKDGKIFKTGTLYLEVKSSMLEVDLEVKSDENIHIHRNFNIKKPYKHNLALIKLADDARLSALTPICLPEDVSTWPRFGKAGKLAGEEILLQNLLYLVLCTTFGNVYMTNSHKISEKEHIFPFSFVLFKGT